MPGPGPAEAAARVAVRRALADVEVGSLVLVACSGGADSVALATAVAFVASRTGLRAGAVVVDHGLQDGSDAVAERAALTCRGLGLAPVEVRTVVVSDGGGPEAAARTARHTAIERAAREHGAAVVLLAHTLDDQAEQVLLALARGSGARSLAGIPARRGAYRRPFLGLRRAQTEAVCRERGLTWWDDPTNGRDVEPAGSAPERTERTERTEGTGSSRSIVPRGQDRVADSSGTGSLPRPDRLPLRSQVRATVLPVLADVLGPGVPEALARSAAQLADDADLLDALARELLERAARPVPPADGDAPSAHGDAPSAHGDAPSAHGDAPSAHGDEMDPHSGSPRWSSSPSEGPRSPSAEAASPSADEPRRRVGRSQRVVALDVQVLADAHRALRTRALRRAAVAVGSPPGALAAAHVEAVDALVTRWRGQGPAHLPGPVLASRECGRLVLRPGPAGNDRQPPSSPGRAPADP